MLFSYNNYAPESYKTLKALGLLVSHSIFHDTIGDREIENWSSLGEVMRTGRVHSDVSALYVCNKS